MGHIEPCFAQFAILSIVESTYSNSVGVCTTEGNVNTYQPCFLGARDYTDSSRVEQLK